MKKRIPVLLTLSVVVLCLRASPVPAALFDFGFGNVRSTFTLDAGGTTGTLEVSKIGGLTMGSVSHLSPAPTSVAGFLWGWGFTGGDFSLSMDIRNISASLMTATGDGDFTITDTTGDKITGKLQGGWTRGGGANMFQGPLADVSFDNAHSDNKFNGHLSFAASMSFSVPQPWTGTGTMTIEEGMTANWFSVGSYTTNSGSVDGSVVVPIPAAVLLGTLGLGTAGLRLRKRAWETRSRL
jgi:hypothetical protein